MGFNLRNELFGQSKYGTTPHERSFLRILKPKHLEIIKLLLETEPYTYFQATLCKRLHIPKATISNLLTPLIKNKLVAYKRSSGLRVSIRLLAINPIYKKELEEIVYAVDRATQKGSYVVCVHHHYAYSFPCDEEFRIYYKVARSFGVKKKMRKNQRKSKRIYTVRVEGTRHSIVVYPNSGEVRIHLNFPVLIRIEKLDELDLSIERRVVEELNEVLDWVESSYNVTFHRQLVASFAFDNNMEISIFRNRVAYYLYLKKAMQEYRGFKRRNPDVSKGSPEVEFKGEMAKCIPKTKQFIGLYDKFEQYNFTEEMIVKFMENWRLENGS